MDILSTAQQQINDAAKTLDPNASGGSAPPSPPPDQPIPTGTPAPLLKEEAILPSPQEGATTAPPPPTPPPMDTPPPSPAFEPSLSDAGDATKTFGGPPPEDSKENKPPPPQKKGMNKGVILAGLFLLLATLPVAVYYISQQQKQIAEIRNKAAICISCTAGTCPNGLNYGVTNCAPEATCAEHIAKICGIGTTPTNPLAATAGTISGTICRDIIKDAGAVFFFNTTKKTVQFVSIDRSTTNYSNKLIPGTYQVQFQSDTDQSPLGYTDAMHNLKSITLGANQTVADINLCDTQSAAPGTDYQSETETVQ